MIISVYILDVIRLGHDRSTIRLLVLGLFSYTISSRADRSPRHLNLGKDGNQNKLSKNTVTYSLASAKEFLDVQRRSL